jgi:hypothetical protein
MGCTLSCDSSLLTLPLSPLLLALPSLPRVFHHGVAQPWPRGVNFRASCPPSDGIVALSATTPTVAGTAPSPRMYLPVRTAQRRILRTCWRCTSALKEGGTSWWGTRLALRRRCGWRLSWKESCKGRNARPRTGTPQLRLLKKLKSQKSPPFHPMRIVSTPSRERTEDAACPRPSPLNRFPSSTGTARLLPPPWPQASPPAAAAPPPPRLLPPPPPLPPSWASSSLPPPTTCPTEGVPSSTSPSPSSASSNPSSLRSSGARPSTDTPTPPSGRSRHGAVRVREGKEGGREGGREGKEGSMSVRTTSVGVRKGSEGEDKRKERGDS